MTKFHEMIETMKTVPYREKKQFLQYFLQMAERAGHQIGPEDKEALMEYAYGEVEAMLRAIPEAAGYREKDLIFECEDYLLGLIMRLCPASGQIPEGRLLKIKALTELVNRERYIETTLDSIFAQSAIEKQDMTRLLYWARQTMDEYQKSKLLLGLVHYQKDFGKINAEAKAILTDYVASELRRLMKLDGEDAWNALELLADVSRHFAEETVISGLQELLRLGRNHINVYAAETLLGLGKEVPEAVIRNLAQDLEFASTTYEMLQRHAQQTRFPRELATEEYLAKSDLVRWLTYPTELGKVPNEIVYIGRIKRLFRKEVFHVFKFRSDSDTLGEDQKNKWLIGWSSNEGGTFSNFDEYAPFEQDTTEKTLKLIGKKLIG